LYNVKYIFQPLKLFKQLSFEKVMADYIPQWIRRIFSRDESKKETKLRPPSEMFEDVVRHTGSMSVDCQLCDRTHFATYEPDGMDWAEEEFEELMKQHKKNPDRYVAHEEDMVSWGHIDGKQAVIDCQCNGLSKYENFIYTNRRIIAEYLTARAKETQGNAGRESGLAQAVSEAVDKV